MCVFFSHTSNGAFISSDRSSIPFDVSLTLKIKRISESNVKECGALEEVVYLSLGM